MNTRRWLMEMAILPGLVCVMNAGCAPLFQARQIHDVYRGRLDESRFVTLREAKQADSMHPGGNYSKLILALSADDAIVVNRVVGQRGVSRGERPAGFQLGELEGRTDADRQRVWIIDREAGRVIASVDCKTKLVTGWQEPPPTWATLDGGTVIESMIPIKN